MKKAIPPRRTILRPKTRKPCPATRGNSPAVYLFAKMPTAGLVKKRLACGIGSVAAAMWYRRSLAHAIELIGRAGPHGTISASPSAHAFRRARPQTKAKLLDQPPGDLGRRMAWVAKSACGASVIVGSDIPSLSGAMLRAACDGVRRLDAVFGPAADGGYYLVGLRNQGHAFRLFDGVRWSGPHALADTLANAPRHWRIAFLPMLRDVDTAEDLHPFQPPARAFVRTISSPARILCEAKSQGRTAADS